MNPTPHRRAAGCVLYELATLQRPFRGSSVSAIAVKILRGTPAPLPDQYSAELRGLVASLLQRRPERRPSMDEVSEGRAGLGWEGGRTDQMWRAFFRPLRAPEHLTSLPRHPNTRPLGAVDGVCAAPPAALL